MGINVQFSDNNISIKSEINEKSLKWLKEIASEIESQVKRNTRVDTGQTKKHWQHYLEEKEGRAYIGNDLENALWEEFGTGEYAINGDGRNGVWYVPEEKCIGKSKPTYNGKVEIVYGKDGTAFYKTNGKKPSRALTKAFEVVKPKTKRIAKEIFGGNNG